ncbi:hypothetical protein ACSBR1_041376 [Camellia fascicularis]
MQTKALYQSLCVGSSPDKEASRLSGEKVSQPTHQTTNCNLHHPPPPPNQGASGFVSAKAFQLTPTGNSPGDGNSAPSPYQGAGRLDGEKAFRHTPPSNNLGVGHSTPPLNKEASRLTGEKAFRPTLPGTG